MSDPHDVTLTIERREHAALVRVIGEVDFRSVPQLREALNNLLLERHDRVVVDLSALTWIDSLGLGVLVASWKRARTAGSSFVLWRPSSKAQAILTLSRLDRVMTVIVDDAIDPFAAA